MNELRASIPGWILDYVALDGSAIYTDSRKVAQAYEKRHDNVLQAIAGLESSAEFRRLNFQVATYEDAQGKPRQMVRMTRDGFLRLVLSFTGKKAGILAERFIEAFGWMARELLLRQMDDHDKRDMQSRVAATMGSRLLNERKWEKPALEQEWRQLRAQLQLGLDFLPPGGSDAPAV